MCCSVPKEQLAPAKTTVSIQVRWEALTRAKGTREVSRFASNELGLHGSEHTYHGPGTPQAGIFPLLTISVIAFNSLSVGIFVTLCFIPLDTLSGTHTLEGQPVGVEVRYELCFCPELQELSDAPVNMLMRHDGCFSAPCRFFALYRYS